MTLLQNEVSTVPEILFAAAEAGGGEYVFHLDEGRVSIDSAELLERSLRAARRLLALGVEPGDAVGILGPNRPEWLVCAFGIWAVGAAVVPAQIPLRINSTDAFAEQQRRMAAAAGCKVILADPRLASLLPEGLGSSWVEEGEESVEDPVFPTSEDIAVIQFTSGSTSVPKGVLISHDAVLAQMEMLYANYFDDGVDHSIVSWAPFFHDLGLISSVVLTAYTQSPFYLLPTERFARDPAEWLRLLDATRAHGAIGPSSAFGSAMRAAARRSEQIDLSAMEVAHFAAEGVNPEVVRRMGEEGKRFSLDPAALGSTYGLAETVLGVSFSGKGEGMKIDRVSLRELADSEIASPTDTEPSRLMFSCGKPMMELRIAGRDGQALSERHVGEIMVRGRSITNGYIGTDSPDPFVAGGWMRTGDMGYLADGELYITGRAKDMVIVTGQNYYPEDFEWAAARVPGVRPGRSVAFSRPGEEGIVLLVEPVRSSTDPGELEREVKRTVRAAIGVPVEVVHVAPCGTLEKTTSGKLRRAAMRDAFVAGNIPALRDVES